MNPARRPWIAGNWKMNGRLASARALAAAVRAGVLAASAPPTSAPPASGGPVVALCPPHVHLAAVREAIAGSPVLLGAQDCAATVDGAFTGEVSAAQLADAGVACVIVGHSERRRDQRESGEILARKLRQAFAAKLTPIFCVGETIDERKAGRTRTVVESQLADSLSPVLDAAGPFVIAYEPVWAIGTGLTATPREAREVHAAIREWLSARSAPLGESVPVLYGGSVTKDNAAGLMAEPEIDGALVGGASLSPESFLAIVRAAARHGGTA